MKRRINFIFLLGLTIITFTACKSNSPQKEAERIVKEWSGKVVQFPSDIPCVSMGVDAPCPELSDSKYKVVLYTDSSGCISCKLQLAEWQRIMEESDSLFAGKVSFFFYFQPQREKELYYELKQDKFDYPVFVDKESKMNKLNRFPSKMEYQCFLLDKENKVLVVGNPTLNRKVWELYKKKINESCD